MQAGRCCKCSPPIPFLGSIYRTYSPALIADYAGYSTASWVSDTLTPVSTFSRNEYYRFDSLDALYYQFTVNNPKTDEHDVILDPVRWTCDMPATNGGRWDYWIGLPGDQTNVAMRDFGWCFGYSGSYRPRDVCIVPREFKPEGIGALAMRPELLPSGSHCEFYDDELTVAYHSLMPVKALAVINSNFNYCTFETSYNVGFQSKADYPFVELNDAVTAAGASYISTTPMSVSIAYVQHRINGSAVGTPQTAFTPLSPVVADDEYAVDIWYRVRTTKGALMSANKTAFTCVLPLSSAGQIPDVGDVATSHMTMLYGANRTHAIAFGNVNMNTAFTVGTHTYNITIAGHSGWTLKGGSDGPHKIQTADTWTAVFADASITWLVPQTDSAYQYVRSIKIMWDSEIARIGFQPGSAMYTAGVESGVDYVYYTPASGTEYRTSSTTINQSGTITHIPCGVFNQGGSTTFNQVEWSILNSYAYQASSRIYGPYRKLDGRRTSALPVITELPTSITVTRTTR